MNGEQFNNSNEHSVLSGQSINVKELSSKRAISLSNEEKITNYETYKHIEMVMFYLSVLQKEIMDRMFTHDRSKLEQPELEIFTKVTNKLADVTYGSDEYKVMLKEMKPALDHHYANNRHHPEFNLLGVDGMNIIDVLEMIVDWYCASRRHNDGDIYKSIEINKDRFNLSPQLASIIKNTIPLLEQAIPAKKTQR